MRCPRPLTAIDQHAEQETAFQQQLSYANIESISADTKPLRAGERCGSSSGINALQEGVEKEHWCDRLVRDDPGILQRLGQCHE